MNKSNAGLIFPPDDIPTLINERDKEWQDLVTGVINSEPNSHDHLAFILMMARLNNCSTCNSDSYRAVRGCSACAKQSLKRFHGSDHELSRLYTTAKNEVVLFMQNKFHTILPLSMTNKNI